MKKILALVMLGFLIFGVTGCKKKETMEGRDKAYNEESKSVVLYFSATGTTQGVAKTIKEAINSDIIEIVPKEKYTKEDLDYNKETSRANLEMSDENARPEIANEINIFKYDTIYIGYPIWWGTNPRIILTLLDTVSLEGKKIALFCTSGSSGIEKSMNDLKEYNTNITILGAKRFTKNSTKEEVLEWIKNL